MVIIKEEPCPSLELLSMNQGLEFNPNLFTVQYCLHCAKSTSLWWMFFFFFFWLLVSCHGLGHRRVFMTAGKMFNVWFTVSCNRCWKNSRLDIWQGNSPTQCGNVGKVSVFGVFLVRVFPHSDWIRRDTEK